MGIVLLIRNILQQGKKEDGSVAVEFALVCIPFIYITIAIMELCWFFATANTLEYSLSTSSRMIRTGQLQASGVTDMEAAFRTDLCSHMKIFVDCSKVGLEAVTIADGNFTTAENNQPTYKADGTLQSQGFDPGSSDSVVLIRVTYRYQMMTPLFSRLFTSTPDQTVPLVSVVVLQNEPYTF